MLRIRKKYKQNKEHSKDPHTESNAMNPYPLTVNLTSQRFFLSPSFSLLLNTCSKQTEGEASLTPLCAVHSSVTIQLLPFYTWFRGGLGIKWNCTRHKLVPEDRIYDFCLQELLAATLLDLGKDKSLFLRHYTFCTYLNINSRIQ